MAGCDPWCCIAGVLGVCLCGAAVLVLEFCVWCVEVLWLCVAWDCLVVVDDVVVLAVVWLFGLVVCSLIG